MRINKVFSILIGITFMLQACGNSGAMETDVPANVEPNDSQFSSAELTAAAAPGGEFFLPISFRSGIGFHGPWLELYFTDPANPLSAHEIGGVDAFLATAIVEAKESVDVALRGLTLDSITKALILAHDRGVAVRVVTETDSLKSRSKLQILEAAGIPLVDDQQAGLMNNRFIIIDHREVWTGSLNYSTVGVFLENAVLLRVFSEELAADYTMEFDEMFVNKQFGLLMVPKTPYPNVTIDGTRVEALFSPDDIVSNRLIQLISEAKESIYFLAFAFGSNDLGKAIRDKAAQGIQVSGILEFNESDPDETNSFQIEQIDLFRRAGLDIRLDGTPEEMNHKFIIIDGKIVVTGSYDFTTRAEIDND